jgi:hypothetical protein
MSLENSNLSGALLDFVSFLVYKYNSLQLLHLFDWDHCGITNSQ